MNRSTFLFLILLIFLISACYSTPVGYIDLEPHVVDAAGLQSILIQVDYGEVTLLSADDSLVSVGGQVLFDDELEYKIDTVDKQINIKLFVHRNPSRNIPLHVMIRLPQQMHVKVETDDASVLVQSYPGNVEIVSTSGDISLQQVTGEMTLRSNRGNISVRESTGVVSIVGNYGGLTAQNVHGDISASTIMGNVVFDGLIEAGDTVHLETDHGAVSVNLSADSALTLRVISTSGDVTCLLPEVASSTRNCDGKMRSGGGSLSIRTVSGAVTLQLIP